MFKASTRLEPRGHVPRCRMTLSRISKRRLPSSSNAEPMFGCSMEIDKPRATKPCALGTATAAKLDWFVAAVIVSERFCTELLDEAVIAAAALCRPGLSVKSSCQLILG